MCLAIVAPKNTDKNSDFLFKAIIKGSMTNRDGMGFAFKRNSTKKVYLSKGYKEVSALIDAIKSKKLGEQDELIVHARIGNKGAINEEMCHPFVASENVEEILLNDKYVDKPVFIHNGTFNKVSKVNSNYSDTYYFARDVIGKPAVMDFLIQDTKTFSEIMSDYLNNSRVAILFPNTDRDLITLGTFIGDSGYLFSNIGYRDTTHYNVGGQSSFDWGEYWERKDEEDRRARQYNGQSNLPVIASTSTNSYDTLDLYPTFRLPDDVIFETFIDPINKYEYRKYMGLLVSNARTIQPVRVVPTPLNFNHLIYQSRELIKEDATNNTYYKIDLLGKYKMGEFDCDYAFYKETIHYIYKSNIADPIPILYNNLLSKFEIKPSIKYKEFYSQYLQLVSNVYPGKNTLKKISKLLKSNTSIDKHTFGRINTDGSIATTKENSKKDRMYFDRDVLELYLFNLIEHLNKNSSDSEIYQEYLNYSF